MVGKRMQNANEEGAAMIEQIPARIVAMLDAIAAAGGTPLVVGGAVRDMLLGLPPKDLDIEVYGLDVERLSAVLQTFGKVDAVGRSFGVLKMRLDDGEEVDFALPRRESKVGAGHRGFLAQPDPTMTPQEAAGRRDFTINAMALTRDDQLLDFYGGRSDLEQKILRHTTPAFAEDPLRVLRGMQFAARFDYTMHPETVELCRHLLREADTLPIERVWTEWWKWATKSVRPSAGLRVLEQTDWLSCYPELQALIGCEQEPEWHPEGDTWLHTLYVCDFAAQIAERDGLDDEQRGILVLAALCHDLGKPATTLVIDGRIRSPGHDQAGVPISETFLKRIGCFDSIVQPILPLVREHMVHIGMPVAARPIRRLALRLQPSNIEQWGRVIEADASGRPPHPPSSPAAEFVQRAHEMSVAERPPEKLVLGRHILAAGIPVAGPALGQLVKDAYQAQLDGEFATLEEGVEWAKQHVA
jgi:tRNA nucleotidyltransferase (CCA-adding enzyme)